MDGLTSFAPPRRTRATIVSPNSAIRSLRPFLLAMMGLFILCAPCRADQGSCLGGADGVAFGSLGIALLDNATAVGDVHVTCPGLLGPTATWDFCASIGVGTNSVSQTDRRMTNGANYISYQLYTDAAYSIPYQYVGSNMVALTYNNLLGVTDTQYVYAKILSSGVGIPPGIYTDTYLTGAQAAVTNDSNPTGNPALECTGNSAAHNWNTNIFTVTAIVLASCGVSATPLDFGSAGVLNANIDVATNLAVTCTFLTPYTVALSAGDGPGATTSARAMTQGAAEVFYALYRDPARTLNWGNNQLVDTESGIGTGGAQSFPVYGRVPAQTTPTIGTYTDTVVVTVTY